MTEPAPQPGWHPDPWKQAQLRWHDGADWTGHVHGDAAVEAASVPVTPTPTPTPHVVDATPTAQSPGATSTSGKAVAALVTSVLGVPIVPIVLGLLARRDITRSGETLRGRGLAMVGIALGVFNTIALVILLMVAIPAILALGIDGSGSATPQRIVDTYQQQAALEDTDRTKQQIKQVVTAIEVCAVQLTDGSYTGCADSKSSKLDASVQRLLATCGSPGGVCITMDPSARGYSVAGAGTGSATGATFTETHAPDGSLSKTCTVPVGTQMGCNNGYW